MASEVTIPRLGWNMDEGTFVGWLKSDGEHVAAGEPLFSLEGDKATQDVESLEPGILRIPPDGPKDGEKIAVGTLIGYLVAPGEPAPFEADRTRNTAVDRVATTPGGRGSPCRACEQQPSARTEPRPPAMKPRISPRARRVARELGVDALGLEGSGNNGRIVERDIRAAAEPSPLLPMLPARPERPFHPRNTARLPSRPSAERSPSEWSRVHRPPPALLSRRPSTPRIWSTCGSNSRRWPSRGRGTLDRASPTSSSS